MFTTEDLYELARWKTVYEVNLVPIITFMKPKFE